MTWWICGGAIAGSLLVLVAAVAATSASLGRLKEAVRVLRRRAEAAAALAEPIARAAALAEPLRDAALVTERRLAMVRARRAGRAAEERHSQ